MNKIPSEMVKSETIASQKDTPVEEEKQSSSLGSSFM
jgi:hypothetical protein